MSRRSGDIRVRLHILWRALRWRSGSAAMLFVVATVAIAGAAIGPMFLRAADDSIVASTVGQAPAGSASVSMVLAGGRQAGDELAAAVVAANRAAGRGVFSAPIFGTDLGTTFSLTGKAASEYSADLFGRTAICQHVHIARGRCPTRAGEVAISERSAAVSLLHIGSRLSLSTAHASRAAPVTIVGLYVQPPTVEDAYWAGTDPFAYGTSAGLVRVIALDALLATRATLLSFVTPQAPVQFSALLSFRRSALVDGSGPIEHELAAVEGAVARRSTVSVSSSLTSIIASAKHDENVMSSVVLAIVLQIVLLSLLVVYALGRTAAEARRPETDFARLRGFPRSALLSLAVGEPAALIAAALPSGILVAWGTLALVGKALFVGRTPLDVTPIALAAAAAGFVAALGATTIASYALWRRPRARGARSTGAATFVIDSFGIALALAGLLALATAGTLGAGHSDPLAAIAPGLLALGAAIIGLRIAAVLARLFVTKSSESRRLPWFLAIRQVARRPEILRRVLPLTAATGVVLFAIGSFAVASENRSNAASFEIGASRVVDVSIPPGLNFVSAVRSADPSGRRAMAAAVYASSSENLLAVDASRLAQVASWPSDLSHRSVAEIATQLSPKISPPIIVRGGRLRINVDLPVRTQPIILSASLFDLTYETPETVSFGPIRAGAHAYSASLQGACSTSCRLVNLSPEWWKSNSFSSRLVHIDVTSMATDPRGIWRPIEFGAGVAGAWRSVTPGVSVATQPAAQGVAISAPSEALLSGGVVVEPADLPLAIPAVVTNELEQFNAPSGPGSQISLEGLDGNSINVSAFSVVPALPAIGQNALLVDLPLAQLAQSSAAVSATDQVWLSAQASPLILERLRHLGVTIGPTMSAAARAGALDKGGLALAYDLALIATPIAALLALGGVAFAIGSEARTRRREIAALRTVGVARRSLERALLLENALVLAVALVIGTAIGFAADALAIPSLPEFTNGSGGFPITTGLPAGALLVTVAALAFGLAIGAAASSFVVFRAGMATRQTDDS